MSRKIGNIGEDIASDFLSTNGFVILERNYFSRFGEIDIIAKKLDRIHIVEVKYRKDEGFGSAIDYVTNKKILKIQKTAKNYFFENDLFDVDWQVDAIAIDPQTKRINYLENVLIGE